MIIPGNDPKHDAWRATVVEEARKRVEAHIEANRHNDGSATGKLLANMRDHDYHRKHAEKAIETSRMNWLVPVDHHKLYQRLAYGGMEVVNDVPSFSPYPPYWDRPMIYYYGFDDFDEAALFMLKVA